MTKRFIDPFFPNRPVDDPENFSGRAHQVEEVIDSLYQIANENPKHTIITGDRGIGKSSLLLQSKLLAEGNNILAEKLNIDKGCDKFNFIIGRYDCNQDSSPETIARGLLASLKQNLESTRLDKLKGFLGNLKFEVDVYGVKITHKEEGQDTITELVNNLCKDLVKIYEQVKDDYSGILLFIDEIDRVKHQTGVGSFFKLFIEKLNREGLKKIGFMAAGITGAIQNLQQEHGSIDRSFRDITIPRLTKEETNEILRNGFSKIGLSIQSEHILDLCYEICAGFPEPVHLLGSELASIDEDGIIDEKDFLIAKKRIITDVRKNKLSGLLKKAGYGKYQKILLSMAKYTGSNVPIKHIENGINEKQNQFSTNIGTLKERGVITQVDRGVYSFTDPLLKEYIKEFGIIESTETGE